MRKLTAALAAIALVGAAAPAFAAADDETPSFENGPVWDFAQIKTKDGHFEEYMKWLSTGWKAQQEALKKAGVIVGYKVLLVADPRENDPDIILATEYPNLAAMDHTVAEQYAMQKKVSGSITDAAAQQAARGSIRTVLGDMLMREAVLK